MRNYQICTKCIMDTSDPDISFDNNGVCHHCNNYQRDSIYLYSRKELEQGIAEIKKAGQGKKYDCLIGLSGGVDSSTVAYLVKELGLRPLAFHFDNGWNTELSMKNIENIVRKLNIDFRTFVVNWEEFKDLQLSFIRAGVPNIEIPTDHAIVALMYKLARENNIKYIIHGGNIKTEAIMPFAWGYNARDLKHLKEIHKRFGTKKLETFPTLSLWKWAYYYVTKKIKKFPVLDYINYDKQKSKEYLKNNLDWKEYGSKHEESLFTKFFQSYILPKKFGFDKRRAHYSTLINSGQMIRQEAIERMKIEPYSDPEEMKKDKEYVIKKFNISEQEFDSIMAEPAKTYMDYPNDYLTEQRLAKTYSFVKKLIP